MRRRPNRARRITAFASFATVLFTTAALAQLGGVDLIAGSGDSGGIIVGERVTVTGTVSVFHADSLASTTSRDTVYLDTDTEGRIELIGTADKGLAPGDTVTVTGDLAQSRLDVGSMPVVTSTTSTTEGTTAARLVARAALSGTKRVAIITFNWEDLALTRTPAQVTAQMLTNPRSVREQVRQGSYGAIDLTAQAFGPYTTAVSKYECGGASGKDGMMGDSWDTATTQARNAAKAKGFVRSNFDYVVYVFPYDASCPGRGWAYIDSNETWIADEPSRTDAFQTKVMVHEFGHAFGVHHAASLACADGTLRVSYSKTCTRSEYGDLFDVMGNGDGTHSTPQRDALGWVPDGQVKDVTADGTYTLHPVENRTGPTGTFTALRIETPAPPDMPWGQSYGRCGAYYVDYRQPIGTDSAYAATDWVKGITVRRDNDCKRGLRTLIYDGTPANATDSQAFLPGTTFHDTSFGLMIQPMSVGSASATVKVVFTKPSVPRNLRVQFRNETNIKLEWDKPTDGVVAEYRIHRVKDDALISTTTNLEWKHEGLAPSTNHSYYVKARDAAGNSSGKSNILETSTTEAPDTTRPTTPGNFRVSSKTARSITLAWNGASDDRGVGGYWIYRADGQFIGWTNASTLTWTHSGLGVYSLHRYYIKAKDEAGNGSAASPILEVRTKAS